jgi:DNA repair protein RecO (recombination protein O)
VRCRNEQQKQGEKRKSTGPPEGGTPNGAPLRKQYWDWNGRLLFERMVVAMSLIKTEAIVLKASDYSESTRLVTLFSPDYGRIRVLAKGIRRLKSRDRGALEPFSRVQATLYLKDPGGLGTFKEGSLLAGATALRDDYDRWLLASLVLEVIDRATLPGEDLGDLYERVCAFLDELKTTGRPGEATAAALAWMLGWFGFGLNLEACGLCGAQGATAGFRIDQSCVVCERCAGQSEYYRPLPPGTIRALQALANPDPSVRRSLRLLPGQLGQVFALLIALLQYHLDVSLASARMLTSATLA